MNPIQIITASAGSGKTYRLAEELSHAAISGEVRPEAILATTFTVKAASELRQRVRARLLSEGHFREAQRLTASRFGTVHAVCARLIDDFAFELGVPPELGVLDDQASKNMLRRVLSEVLTGEDEDRVAHLQEVFGEDWDWQDGVQRVIDLARSNGMSPESLTACAERSLKEFLPLFGQPLSEERNPEAELRAAIKDSLRDLPVPGDETKKTQGAINILEKTLWRLESGQPLTWSEWIKLSGLGVAVKSREAVEPVHEAAGQHDHHPALQQDVSDSVEFVFDLAARTMEAYVQHKLAHGVLDFVDQEAYALQLLQMESVRECLVPDLDLVLVDEFQDTSPMQLAIFLELASLARRSVWVGDPKQSVFAFRGTDPSLIDAVIEEVCQGREPETLQKSWRSRPELVERTSDLFAKPFAAVGIPERRVVLAPGRVESEDLGPIMEHWVLESKNKTNDALALAAAVSELLTDDVRVRDPKSGTVRVLRAGDVAILCRRNDTCTAVTKALEARGIRVVLPRPGLLGTLEGRILFAALRLWVDPENTLAEAELAYLTDYPGDGDAWLSRGVEAHGDHAFRESPVVLAVLEARAGSPGASPVAAVDGILEATGILELCHRWGGSVPRLANVEKFRSHTVSYQQTRLSEGKAATVAGLVLHLEDIRAKGEDHQGEASGPDAVTVSTWHRAKGLEWPVTVLYELGSKDRIQSLGVHVETDHAMPDLRDPLRGRWIRYWPYPYGSARSGIPMLDRLVGHIRERQAQEKSRREEMRLLYVGWTRARDRLVMAAREGKLTGGILGLLSAGGGAGLIEVEGEQMLLAGMPTEIVRRRSGPEPAEFLAPEPDLMLPAHEPRKYPPAVIRPSGISEIGQVAEPVILGDPIRMHGKPAWDHLGNAVHGFFAADRTEYSSELRLIIARRLLEGWEVAESLHPEELLEMSDRLDRWIERCWPGVRRFREMPLEVVQENGSRLVGVADLVLETEEGLVLIDHKSFPGTREQAAGEAAKYFGQLDAYRRMLEAETGKPVVATMIHCPVSGIILPLTGQDHDPRN